MTSAFYAIVVGFFMEEFLCCYSLAIIFLVVLSAAAIFERIGLPRIIGKLEWITDNSYSNIIRIEYLILHLTLSPKSGKI
jgi:hypothetical protein